MAQGAVQGASEMIRVRALAVDSENSYAKRTYESTKKRPARGPRCTTRPRCRTTTTGRRRTTQPPPLFWGGGNTQVTGRCTWAPDPAGDSDPVVAKDQRGMAFARKSRNRVGTYAAFRSPTLAARCGTARDDAASWDDAGWAGSREPPGAPAPHQNITFENKGGGG